MSHARVVPSNGSCDPTPMVRACTLSFSGLQMVCVRGINIVYVGGLFSRTCWHEGLVGSRPSQSALAARWVTRTRVHEPRGRPRLPVKRHVAARAAPPVLGTTENLTRTPRGPRAPKPLRPNPLPSCGPLFGSPVTLRPGFFNPTVTNLVRIEPQHRASGLVVQPI